MADLSMAAQVLKNLGSSIERLGNPDAAVEHFREALRHNTDLPEAHNALRNHLVGIGSYAEALDHFDRAIFAEAQMGRVSAITGWKVNVLFNLGEGRAAFREINTLLTRADREPWIWQWCSQQVGSFGRTTPENARQALLFWRRFVGAHPDMASARRELLQVAFYLLLRRLHIPFCCRRPHAAGAVASLGRRPRNRYAFWSGSAGCAGLSLTGRAAAIAAW